MTSLSDLPWRSSATGISEMHPDERILDHSSTHWVKYLVPATLYLLLQISGCALLYILWDLPDPALMIAALFIVGAMLMLHHWFFHKVLGLSLDTIILTNKRFIVAEANLWYNDDSTEISIAQVHTVEAYKKGFIQHLFNYGSLWFDTGGSSFEEGRLVPLVPNPHHRASLIANLLRDYAQPGMK